IRSRSTRSTSSPTTAAARSRSFLVARHPARVRSLLLTNCDGHTEAPPAIFAPVVAAAQRGTYADEFVRHLVDKPFADPPRALGESATPTRLLSPTRRLSTTSCRCCARRRGGRS